MLAFITNLQGNPDIDVSYQYLTFFLDDDEELKRYVSASWFLLKKNKRNNYKLIWRDTINKLPCFYVGSWHCRIYDEYKSGRMLTGELKKILIDLLVEITSSHQVTIYLRILSNFHVLLATLCFVFLLKHYTTSIIDTRSNGGARSLLRPSSNSSLPINSNKSISVQSGLNFSEVNSDNTFITTASFNIL